MTHAILIHVTSSTDRDAVLSKLRTHGFVVGSSLFVIGNNSYVIVKFGASFTGTKQWMREMGMPVYVYNGEVDGHLITLNDIQCVDTFSNGNLKYTYVFAQEPTFSESRCSACNDIISEDGYVIINPLTSETYCNKCVEGWYSCAVCGVRHSPDTSVQYTSQTSTMQVCKKCWKDHSTTCGVCGTRVLSPDTLIIDHTELCYRCHNNPDVVYLCTDCHTPHLIPNLATDGHMHLCGSCRRNYNECTSCHRFINRREYPPDVLDGSVFCESCTRPRKFFGDHRYVPNELKFFRTSSTDVSPFFGMEFEMVRGNRVRTLTALRDMQEIWCKRDGSIDHTSGIEVVTHPCTYDYYMQDFPWSSFLRTCIDNGYVSHLDGHCGLHIHIDKNSLKPNVDVNALKIVWVINAFWSEFKRFSRRNQSNLDRWAQRYGELTSPIVDLKRTVHEVKSISANSRYMCVNLQPPNTVELRFIRGSLNLETIIASVQLCKVLVDLKEVSIIDIVGMSWSAFYDRCSEYPELIAYMKRRGIKRDNISPVVAEEEEETNTRNDVIVNSLNDLLHRSSAHSSIPEPFAYESPSLNMLDL